MQVLGARLEVVKHVLRAGGGGEGGGPNTSVDAMVCLPVCLQPSGPASPGPRQRPPPPRRLPRRTCLRCMLPASRHSMPYSPPAWGAVVRVGCSPVPHAQQRSQLARGTLVLPRPPPAQAAARRRPGSPPRRLAMAKTPL